MQQFYCVKEILNDGLKRGYEFAVKNGYVEGKVEEKLREIAASAKIDGFRKGKVSPEFLRRTYGESVASDVVSQVVDDVSSAFLKENNFDNIVTSNVKISSYPKACTNSEKDEDLVYELQFELMPEVPEVDLDSITLREIEVKASSEDIDAFLEDLRANYPSYAPVEGSDHGITKGDHVTMSYSSLFNGKALRGGSTKGFTFVMGERQLLEQFEEQITGMKVGESKEFKLKFPADYGAKHFAGKEVDMHVTVDGLKVRNEISGRDELAKKCGFQTVDEMVESATNSLNERFANMSRVVMQKELLDHIDNTCDVSVPEFVVSQEIGRMSRELSEAEGGSGDADGIKTEAERRVKLGLVLMKISGDAGITVENSDIFAFLRANYYSYGRSLDAVIKLFKASRDFRDHVRGKVLEDKVVGYIITRAKKEKQSMSAEELKSLFESI
ncbi:trigger factor [Candidatus Anaplasma sp. TIGMIC]|uniref:trigger factor n=1 Tax=Candidatus Anaplasma sp. TIGMIC TaxID=3020713 RepID=UPI00233094AA|nr:trigger factor [Candidatus Anaplasma sp. TIGMIC]MDB1135040.1 trigger factor [Candidatus Anaplasma sp. TIGMIC]